LGDVKAIMIDSLVVIVSCALTHPKELVKKMDKKHFQRSESGLVGCVFHWKTCKTLQKEESDVHLKTHATTNGSVYQSRCISSSR